jgi:hypothetical protein
VKFTKCQSHKNNLKELSFKLLNLLLVHEFVEAAVKVSPHVGVKMDSSDALGMGRGRDVVGKDKGPGKAVEEDVLDVEELTNAVPGAAKGPQVDNL